MEADIPDLLKLADSYSSSGKYNKAISYYTRALMLVPYDMLVYFQRGKAYFRNGDYARALEDLKRAQGLGMKIDAQLLNQVRAKAAQR